MLILPRAGTADLGANFQFSTDTGAFHLTHGPLFAKHISVVLRLQRRPERFAVNRNLNGNPSRSKLPSWSIAASFDIPSNEKGLSGFAAYFRGALHFGRAHTWPVWSLQQAEVRDDRVAECKSSFIRGTESQPALLKEGHLVTALMRKPCFQSMQRQKKGNNRRAIRQGGRWLGMRRGGSEFKGEGWDSGLPLVLGLQFHCPEKGILAVEALVLPVSVNAPLRVCNEHLMFLSSFFFSVAPSKWSLFFPNYISLRAIKLTSRQHHVLSFGVTSAEQISSLPRRDSFNFTAEDSSINWLFMYVF